jgi:capsular polysaccharide transport system permease protein
MTKQVAQLETEIEPAAAVSAPAAVVELESGEGRLVVTEAAPLLAAATWIGTLGRRRREIPWTPLSFVACVAAPTFACAIYLLLLATPRYETEFRVAVRSVGGPKMTELPSLLGLSGTTPLGNDSYAVVQYLQSRDALEDIDEKTSLRDHFSGSSIDYWSRLNAKAPIERFVLYWRKMLDAYYETMSGTIIVRVSTFTPEESLAVGNAALALSESLINTMSLKARDDTLSFARTEVGKAEARLEDINVKMTRLRNKDSVLDVRSAAEGALSVAAKLKTEIANLRANLATQSLSMGQDSPAVTATKRNLIGLQQELVRVESEITASPNTTGEPLSSVIGDFSQLENEHMFAEKAYQAALASLEASRADAARQQVYLATIVRPELPQEPSFPRPFRQSVTFFAVALALWAVATLLVSAVKRRF